MLNIQLNNNEFKAFIEQEIDKRLATSNGVPYMMDTKMACNYLSVSRPTLNALMKDTDLITYSVGSKKLYKREDIEQLANFLCERSKSKNYDLLQ